MVTVGPWSVSVGPGIEMVLVVICPAEVLWYVVIKIDWMSVWYEVKNTVDAAGAGSTCVTVCVVPGSLRVTVVGSELAVVVMVIVLYTTSGDADAAA